jgi:uncharacterized protein (TIGR01244 family)
VKNHSYLILTCISIFLTVNADEAPSEMGGSIHVAIDAVVATGDVAPVDGITSSGQPDEVALRIFADAGYTAVIDMRGPDEERGLDDEEAAVRAVGLDYIPFPITSRDEINLDAATQLDAILQGIDGPVLIHCGSGDRVGAILALRHSLRGANDEDSVAHGKDAGLNKLEDTVRDRLDNK